MTARMEALYGNRNLLSEDRYAHKAELLRHFVEELSDEIGGYLDVSHMGEVEEIETHWRDGFIPYTNGGFNLFGYADLSLAFGSGSVPENVKDILSGTMKDCEESFKADNGIPEGADLWAYLEENEPLREEYYECENTWLTEGASYFYRVQVSVFDVDNRFNETGEPEAMLLVGINTDLEYGRSKGDIWVYEKTIPLKRVTSTVIEKEIKWAAMALATNA